MVSSVLTPQSTRLHLWTPGLFDFKGGIQTFSTFFWQALQDCLPHASQRLFALHDRTYPKPLSLPSYRTFHGMGHVPARIRIPLFGADLLRWGLVDRPHLILATHLNLTAVAYYLKQIAHIPYWTVAHGFEAWDIHKPILRKALAHADRILAVSHYTRDRLIQDQGLDPGKIYVLPNTFEASRFQVAPKPLHLLKRYHLEPEQPVILTVNRLAAGEPFRPYDQMLAALPQILKAIPNIRYLIVGKGSDRDRLEAEIFRQNLQNVVTLAGFVPDEELGDHYNLCDLYAMPSKLEGFGIVFLEALASGKPVLASNQDGGQDALCNGELGALVNPEDISQIAQTCIAILQQTYPNSLIYRPSALRQAAIQRFGFDQFRHQLASQLQNSPLRSVVPNQDFSRSLSPPLH